MNRAGEAMRSDVNALMQGGLADWLADQVAMRDSARELRALFRGGEVIVAIEADNLFESGGMDAADDQANVERAARQFGAMTGLALAINQNDRGRVLQPGPQGNSAP
jgi:hypothetical protein